MWRNLCEISCGHSPWKYNLRKIRQNFAAFFASLFRLTDQKFTRISLWGTTGITSCLCFTQTLTGRTCWPARIFFSPAPLPAIYQEKASVGLPRQQKWGMELQFSEKRSVPSGTGGERILEMLWRLQMP